MLKGGICCGNKYSRLKSIRKETFVGCSFNWDGQNWTHQEGKIWVRMGSKGVGPEDAWRAFQA